MTVGDSLPDGSVILLEVATDEDGNVVPVDDPRAVAIEVETRTPGGEVERTYLERPRPA